MHTPGLSICSWVCPWSPPCSPWEWEWWYAFSALEPPRLLMNWTLIENQALHISTYHIAPLYWKTGSVGPVAPVVRVNIAFHLNETFRSFNCWLWVFRRGRHKQRPSASQEKVSGHGSLHDSPSSMPNRKLPVLPSTLVIPVPVDNPVRHQGRTRTVPHVAGNWAAHVYLSVNVNRSHALCSLLEAAVAEAKRLVPALESFIPAECINKHAIEFHISLSRPIFIRGHQKEELRRAVKELSQHSPYEEHFPQDSNLNSDCMICSDLNYPLRLLQNCKMMRVHELS